MTDRIKIGTQIYQYFLSKGMAPHQAAAIAGNMAWEGGGRTDLVNPGDNYRNSPRSPHSVGVGQWNDRLPALVDFARRQGVEIPEGDLRDARYVRSVAGQLPLQTQLDFAWNEMQGPERRAYERITAANDLRGANAGAIGYHRPAGWTRSNPYAGHGFQNRYALADQIMRASTDQPASDQPPMPPAMALGAPKSAPRPVTWPAYTPMRAEPETPVRPAFDARAFWEDQDRGRFADGGETGDTSTPRSATTANDPWLRGWLYDRTGSSATADVLEGVLTYGPLAIAGARAGGRGTSYNHISDYLKFMNEPPPSFKAPAASEPAPAPPSVEAPPLTALQSMLKRAEETSKTRNRATGGAVVGDSDAVAKALRIAERQTERKPTEAQKESGNYAKGKFRWNGLEIAVENPKGAKRSGVDKNGKRWECTQPATYGYVLGTRGSDGDHVDVYVGDDHASDKVFVVDQLNADTGKFDEHKAMLGFPSKAAAVQTYAKAFSDGKAKDRLGAVTEMSVDAFKGWLSKPSNTKKPMDKTMAKDKSLQLARQYATGGRVGYAEGGPPISDMGGMGGEEFGQGYDPEGAARFLALLRGAGTEAAKSVAPQADIAMPDASIARQIQNRAMRGMEPTPEQAAYLASIAPAKDARGEALSDIGTSAAAYMVPGSVYWKALKYAGVPASLVVGGSLLDEAKAQTGPVRYDGAPRPRQQVEQLQKQLLDAGYNVKVDGNDGGATRDAELLWKEKRAAEDRRLRAAEQAAAARATEATTAAERVAADKVAADRAATERAAGLVKFEEAQKDPANAPYLTPNMGYGIGAGVGTLLGLGTSAAFDWKARSAMKAANALLANVGAKGKAAGTISERVGKVNEFAKQGGADKIPFTYAPAKDPPWKATAKPTPASDLFPARSMKPEYMTQGALVAGGLTESGVSAWMASGAHERLKEAETAVKATPNAATIAAYLDARNSANMWESLENVGRGWALTQATAAKLGPMAFGANRRPDVPKYEGEVGSVSSKLRKDAKRAKEYDEKTAAEKAAKEQQKSERAAARAAKKPNSKLHAATGLAGGSQLLAEPLGQEEPALPFSQEPSSSFSSFGEPYADGGEADKHHSHFQPRKIGKFAGGPVYPEPVSKSLTEGRDCGGRVNGGALALARKYAGKLKRAFGGRAEGGDIGLARAYANGGHVESGPIVGDHGGRADTRPISVPSGAFIIPSDVVSGLDEAGGNTQAGFRALERMFGTSQPQAADASGSPVDIKISDGEFVIPPSVVARIGKGDMEAGHRALDLFVKKVRAEHIKKLAALPPPATS